MQVTGKRQGITPDEVADAAEACFRKFGVRRTMMADVATQAGVTRQTVYRLFANRTQLLEYVASRHMVEIGRRLKKDFEAFASLAEALVEGSVQSVQAGLHDPLLAEIFEQNDDHTFEKFVFQGSEEVQAIMLDLWGPLLDRARSEGHLREGITNDHAVGWIRNIHSLATLRDDYEVADCRRMFADFLVPSLVTP